MNPSQLDNMISYSLNYEDVLLNRVFAGKTDGFYVDVGANHPTISSMTKHFYHLGWHGINIEPNPTLVNLLNSERPRDVNLGLGLSDSPGELTFYQVIEDHGLSTFSQQVGDHQRDQGFTIDPIMVKVRTLASIITEYAAERTIDFLKIDVEGHEARVLAGMDFKQSRPRMLIIESTLPNTNILCHHEWEPRLLAEDYRFAFFDGVNRYYVRSEDETLLPRLSYPVNILDRFISSREYELETALADYMKLGRIPRSLARSAQWLVNRTKPLRRNATP